MANFNYYIDENGGCYIQGTTFSFMDSYEMSDWAKECGVELTEIDVPEDFEEKTLVW